MDGLMEIHHKISSCIHTQEARFFFASLPALVSDKMLCQSYFLKLEAGSFIELLARHRMIPAFYLGTDKSDKEVEKAPLFSALKNSYARFSRKSLLLSGEMIKISHAAGTRNIPLFFLKGPVLAHKLFGENSVRQSVDLDAYTSTRYLDQVGRLLDCLDYKFTGKTTRQSISIRNYSHKDWLFKHATQPVQLEVHHRYFFNKYFNGLFAAKCPKPVKYNFRGNEVLTLPDAWHFLYLVAHGTFHQYFRLFWLHDIAVFIRSGRIKDWDMMQHHAASTDLLVHLYLTIRLLKLFYQLEVPGFIPQNQSLYNKSYRLVTR
ncbi:MAG: nucleotidyltransferase family protein [Bacteroidota bacterium]